MHALNSHFQMEFVVMISDSSDVIAIDDIVFDGCTVESYSPCEVLCDNLLCVPFSEKCDYSDDCTDGTDERNCGKCAVYPTEDD